VAGTVGALDNTIGAVGVAPGVRLWAVKILNDSGSGLLSWYVCGLDWILAQKHPGDPSRPLFEAVNMSVAKDGADDKNCGNSSNDILHRAICRVVAAGIPVVAAAANDSKNARTRVPAAYSQTITVSALADTDGKPGGLGGNRCYSWGSYDKDDTFADFSNYGKVVDLIAPGKCIWSTKPGSTYGYSSGTSMAAPHVAGAIALYKASRPHATPAEVKEALQYLGNLNWDLSTDPDSYHEKLLDVSKIGPLGSFTVAAASPPAVGEMGGTVQAPVSVGRSPTFFERVRLTVSGVPAGWKATTDATSLMGWTATATTLRVTVPAGVPSGRYDIRITGTNQGRSVQAVVPVVVESDPPVAQPPVARPAVNRTLGSTKVPFTILWKAATDESSAIAGYELQASRDDGAWGSTIRTNATTRHARVSLSVGSTYRFRVRARDAVGNWSPWAVSTLTYRPVVVNERSSKITYKGTWSKVSSSSATSGTLLSTRSNGASATYTFTGKGIAVVAPRSTSRGWLRIHVDGVLVKTVSLRTSTLQHRRILYAREWPASGTHTIKVTAVTSGSRPLVSLDAFIVVR
jgi:subtilisin family serine protease